MIDVALTPALADARHCVQPAGFDQSNSPSETLEVRGEELVPATTNGATACAAGRSREPASTVDQDDTVSV